jgi:hypothetical protein
LQSVKPCRKRMLLLFAAAMTCAPKSGWAALEPNDTIVVEWSGPPTCPRDDFDEALGGYLQGVADDHVRVVVRVDERSPDRWHLELVFDDGRSSRALQGRSCTEVVEAAAWIVAIAIDPTVADRMLGSRTPDPEDPTEDPTEDQAEDAATVPAPPDMEPDRGEAPEPPAGRRRPTRRPEPDLAMPPSEPEDPSMVARPVRVLLGVEAGPDGGSFPGVGALVRGHVGVGRGNWRVDLTGAVRTPTEEMLGTSVGSRFDLWLLGLHAGPVLGPWPVAVGSLELPLWVGFEAGQVTARAFGFDAARTVGRTVLGPTAGAALAWVVHPRVSLRFGVDMLLTPWRHEFFVGGLGVVHRMGWVTGRGTVGLEVRLGRP